MRSAPKPLRRQVSRAVQHSAHDAPCSLRLEGCLPGNDTVVLAHLRVPGSVGVGRKSHDLTAVYACAHCHDVIDRRAAGDFGAGDLLRALIETQTALLEQGLIRIAK